jgi:hypothetical protein
MVARQVPLPHQATFTKADIDLPFKPVWNRVKQEIVLATVASHVDFHCNVTATFCVASWAARKLSESLTN